MHGAIFGMVGKWVVDMVETIFTMKVQVLEGPRHPVMLSLMSSVESFPCGGPTCSVGLRKCRLSPRARGGCPNGELRTLVAVH